MNLCVCVYVCVCVCGGTACRGKRILGPDPDELEFQHALNTRAQAAATVAAARVPSLLREKLPKLRRDETGKMVEAGPGNEPNDAPDGKADDPAPRRVMFDLGDGKTAAPGDSDSDTGPAGPTVHTAQGGVPEKALRRHMSGAATRTSRYATTAGQRCTVCTALFSPAAVPGLHGGSSSSTNERWPCARRRSLPAGGGC